MAVQTTLLKWKPRVGDAGVQGARRMEHKQHWHGESITEEPCLARSVPTSCA